MPLSQGFNHERARKVKFHEGFHCFGRPPEFGKLTQPEIAHELGVPLDRSGAGRARRRIDTGRSLNCLVQETLEMLAYPLRVDNLEVVFKLGDGMPSLWGDPHRLQQVITTLVTDTHHAMRESRQLREGERGFRVEEGPGRSTDAPRTHWFGYVRSG